MENTTYNATIINRDYVEVSLCDVVPDFVHVVKYNHDANVEVFFDPDVDWTPELEEEAMALATHTLPLLQFAAI